MAAALSLDRECCDLDAATGAIQRGDLQLAVALHGRGLHEDDIAAHRRPDQPRRHARLVDPLLRLVIEARPAQGAPHEGAVHLLRPDQATLTERTGLDPSRRLFELAWTPAPDTELISAGTGLWDMALNRGALGVAAQQLGLTQRMLDLAIDYSAQRKQFGKAIGAYQAVKHLLADVAIQLEFAKPVLLRAAAALAHGLPHAGMHVSHARVAAARCAWTAARQAMRLLGSHFVLGQTIQEALSRAGNSPEFRYSFDMLGEGARTSADAERYFKSYSEAIEAIGSSAQEPDLPQRPGISVKLSALHPRYEAISHDRVMRELTPKVLDLARQARLAAGGGQVQDRGLGSVRLLSHERCS